MAQVKEDKRLKKNYSVLVLDKSGSMSYVADATKKGFNEQVQELKLNADKFKDQEFYATFVTFNSSPELVFLNEKVEELYELKEDVYKPAGTTAMFDAIGMAIEEVIKDLGDELDDDNNTVNAAVNVIIMTDGQENASSKQNLKKVPGLIKELQTTGKWTFALIGANIDIDELAARINIPTENAVSYTSNVTGTKKAFATMRQASNSYHDRRTRGITGQALQESFFTNDEGEKMVADIEEDDED